MKIVKLVGLLVVALLLVATIVLNVRALPLGCNDLAVAKMDVYVLVVYWGIFLVAALERCATNKDDAVAVLAGLGCMGVMIVGVPMTFFVGMGGFEYTCGGLGDWRPETWLAGVWTTTFLCGLSLIPVGVFLHKAVSAK